MQNNIKGLYEVILPLLLYEKETGSLYITEQLVYSNKNRSVLAISYIIRLSSLSFFPYNMYSSLGFSYFSYCFSVQCSPFFPLFFCALYWVIVLSSVSHVLEGYLFSLRKLYYFDEQGLASSEWCHNSNASRKSYGINCPLLLLKGFVLFLM